MKIGFLNAMLLLIALGVFSSCKKKNDLPVPAAGSGLLKTVTTVGYSWGSNVGPQITDTTIVTYVSYDNQNRPLLVTTNYNSQQIVNTTSSWTYNINSVVNVVTNTSDGSILYRNIYYLNAAGYCTSEGDGSMQFAYYTYDTNGNLISALQIEPGGTLYQSPDTIITTYTYNSENSVVSSKDNVNGLTTYNYSYLNGYTVPETLNWWLGNSYTYSSAFTLPPVYNWWLNKAPTELWTQETATNGNGVVPATAAYTFNSKNQIIQENYVVIYPNGVDSSKVYLTYY